jgi:adenosylhomocysteinase
VPAVGPSDGEDWAQLVRLLERSLRSSPAVERDRENIRGVTEETTTGVHRLYQMQERGSCPSRR